MEIKIKIKYKETEKDIFVDTEMKISHLKMIIEENLDIPTEKQILMYNDRELKKEDKSLFAVNLREGSIVLVQCQKETGNKKGGGMGSIMNMFPGIENELDYNDELREIINNPALMDEMEGLAMNPASYNQHAKNADVAMAKLDTLPNGLNIMNELYNNTNGQFSDMISNRFKKEINNGKRIEEAVTEPIPNPNVKFNWLFFYRKQLVELRKFGFTNIKKNLVALKYCKGDICDSIKYLVEG